MQQIQSSLSKQDKFQLVADMLEINHVTTALESLALASKTGLDLHMLYDIIVGAAGNSTAYELIGADLLGLPPTVDGKIGTLEELVRFPFSSILFLEWTTNVSWGFPLSSAV